MLNTTTIAAIATPPGSGGVAIVRVSGDQARKIAERVFSAKLADHQMTYGKILDEDGSPLDEAMAVLMLSPRSYTREDVLELHCHGGPYLAQRVLKRCIQAGAEPAQPGEFTRRAFENGRLDLSQAQAVMDMVRAESDAAARAALSRLQGGFAKELQEIGDRLIDEAARLEALMDYPDEDLEEIAASEAADTIGSIIENLESAIRSADTGRKIRQGVHVAIIGPPNAGKSSLMNALLRSERAIVTELPGTTRDTLMEPIQLGGNLFWLTDTAGLRQSGDIIEQLGIERAKKAIDEADLLLLCLDKTKHIEQDMLTFAKDSRTILIFNKDDLPKGLEPSQFPDALFVSALTGDGLSELEQTLIQRANITTPSSLLFTHESDVSAANKAIEALNTAISALTEGMMDVAATEIRLAAHALSEITQTDDDEILSRMFEKFCLGK